MNQVTYHDFGLFKTELLSTNNRLTSYFQSLGFNYYQKQLNSNQFRQDINNNNSYYNQFEVYFLLKIPYQKDIIQLQFPGVSGKQFYKLIKQRLFNGRNFQIQFFLG